jgi:UDP-N-acetylglucosamine/UDP-N-acetylgalactosamine diphosphorylase
MSATGPAVPEHLLRSLRRHGQEHVLVGWDRLDAAGRQALAEQLGSLDLELLCGLWAERDRAGQVPDPATFEPVPVIPRDHAENPRRRRLGEESLRRGEVAVLVVAGGQGTRLGFDHPKGMYPVGPVSRKSLFGVHVEKVRGLGRRYGALPPLLIMTSPATHDETVAYFRDNGFFGMPPDAVHFFCQGTLPALHLETGQLLLEAPGRLFLSPDGHGGTVTALAGSGLLGRLRERGIRHVFYFQVDNPLVKVGDPTFLGHHIVHGAEVSSKVIPKEGPTDRLGNFVQIGGRCTIIEYSDLPEHLARQTGRDGRLRLWAGSPAIHYFDTDFLARVTGAGTSLPLHLARKKVPHLGPDGRTVQPQKENALKFERFIFDVLPLADRWTLVETPRREEFLPLKNAAGADSPAEVERAISDLAADWLAAAGVSVPRDAAGHAAVPLEVSPLVALDAEEFISKADPGWRIDGPRYFGDA